MAFTSRHIFFRARAGDAVSPPEVSNSHMFFQRGPSAMDDCAFALDGHREGWRAGCRPFWVSRPAKSETDFRRVFRASAVCFLGGGLADGGRAKRAGCGFFFFILG